MHRFRKGWMGKDHLVQALFRRLQRMGNAKSLNLLRHIAAHHMRAEQLAALRIKQGFDKALRFAKRQRFAVGLIGENADADFPPAGTRACFG